MNTSLRLALQSTQAQLSAVSDAPALESAWLVEHVCGWNPQQQRREPDGLLTTSQAQRLQALTAQRAAGMPLAYVLGEQHFWTLQLKITPAVLIPRPETELVVERALHHLPPGPASVLDLGTGSGAIALAVAKERPQVRVLAVDQSAAALQVAQDNARLNEVCNVTFQLSDWWQGVPRQPFALIVSNPPYIAAGDPHLQPAVLAHEPRAALLSGSDGLDALRSIIAQAPAFMAPGSWLVLEHGWQQAPAVRQLLESAGLSGVASHADLAGHLRVTEARRS